MRHTITLLAAQMRRFALCACLAAGCAGLWPGCARSPAQRLASDPAHTTLDTRIAFAVSSGSSPSWALVVFSPDDILYGRASGLADTDERLPADLDTAYPLASVSKLYTALAILASTDGEPPETLLLRHVSGIGQDGETITPPGIRRHYTNRAYDLALANAARRIGVDPLAMLENALRTTGATGATILEGEQLERRIATPYGASGRRVPPRGERLGLGSGGVAATPRDLAATGQFLLRHHRLLEALLRPQPGITPPAAIAFEPLADRHRTIRAWIASGGGEGTAAELILLPAERIGFAILCNSPYDPAEFRRLRNAVFDLAGIGRLSRLPAPVLAAADAAGTYSSGNTRAVFSLDSGGNLVRDGHGQLLRTGPRTFTRAPTTGGTLARRLALDTGDYWEFCVVSGRAVGVISPDGHFLPREAAAPPRG